ncbi:CPBP family intramembrane glutamic endopeptidase [Haloprofundus sp. MHR1]|uniref:CPBP family intramembrane glutamic endopeptidase n=1 Tax=Haloprofundus sp. MHR1 TaxID=2572921 RepID=UPI0010BF399C|nr:type II CAAX endopeptidase family protein [Haloprofundus sp. MHR1]QCJ47536.1 CPBP family intramembrane metalloprotease [Haloprofundus sp. MHR1]
MADWTTFAGFAGVVLFLLLLLARASQGVVSDGNAARDDNAVGDGTTDTDENGTEREPVVGATSADTASADSGVFAGPSDADTDAADSTTVTAAESTAADAPPDVAAVDGERDTTPVDGERDTTPVAERPERLEDAEFPGRVRYGPSPARQAGDDGADSTDISLGAAGDLSTGALLANVALSQGLFAGLLLAGAWVAEIPASAFGVTAATTDLTALGLGVAFGVGLYVLNEAAAMVGERFDLGGGEALREALAPDSVGGWAVLLLVVLPVIAGFEELLFRGALIGVLSTGFGLSPWLLALLSSVAFGLGHGAQGPVGILVTGAIGFVLAAAFVLTESLLVVVVAHYLVNALEFVVHEGLGWEWTGRERTS